MIRRTICADNLEGKSPMRAMPLFAAILTTTASLLAQSPASYHVSHTYVLGGTGGWDYIIPDPSSHRLFIAREDRVMVVDEETGKLTAEIKEIHGAHGTAIATGTGHGFLTSSEDKSVVMFDTKTLAILKRIPAADDADAIVYDNVSGRVFSLNGDANSTTVIDAKQGTLIKNLPLGGKPEYGAAAGDGKLYVNLEDKNEIAEVDTAKLAVTRRWSTGTCKLPVSMAIDTKHHRLFSGCRSGVMAVSDYVAGKVITTLPIEKGVDGGGFDPALGDIFMSNADGTLSVFHQDGPDTYHAVQSVVTPVGSRNLGVDPVKHRVYLVSAKFGPMTAGGKRGPVLPDTFTLMVVER
ncbi:YncE family protein [Terriglobus roseus]|uniref:DNA-binding beta-propeller fold protein YncE n=1 Tax=Terriglobus roseus TaxID=392734 RepID=A0A1G7KPX8_9BACT|nr:DUF5074 domain-containing protein [Terriglobus roseus]SDF39235.1 DNA-binding beta-propeller fold protein YncE [Terriglobus roseus]